MARFVRAGGARAMFSSGLKGEKSGMDRAERSPEVNSGSRQGLAQAPPTEDGGSYPDPIELSPKLLRAEPRPAPPRRGLRARYLPRAKKNSTTDQFGPLRSRTDPNGPPRPGTRTNPSRRERGRTRTLRSRSLRSLRCPNGPERTPPRPEQTPPAWGDGHPIRAPIRGGRIHGRSGPSPAVLSPRWGPVW